MRRGAQLVEAGHPALSQVLAVVDAEYMRALLALRRALNKELDAVQVADAPTAELPVAMVLVIEHRADYLASFDNER